MSQLSKSEKQEIVNLIKCKRDKKRQHINDKLKEKADNLTNNLYADKARLESEIKEIQKKIDELLKKNHLDKINGRGCFENHPELDKFDEETNEELLKVWKGEL